MADVEGEGAADRGGIGVPAELDHTQQQDPARRKAGGQHGNDTPAPLSLRAPKKGSAPLPSSTYLGMWASFVVGVHQSK